MRLSGSKVSAKMPYKSAPVEIVAMSSLFSISMGLLLSRHCTDAAGTNPQHLP
jgi:hypothetical protein